MSRKTQRMQVLLTEAQHAYIRDRAHELRITMGEWIRRAITAQMEAEKEDKR